MEKLDVTAMMKNFDSEFFLEYYLLEREDLNYSFKIKKFENKPEKMKLCEDYTSNYKICDENKAHEILKTFARNTVTPTTADYILHDLGCLEIQK